MARATWEITIEHPGLGKVRTIKGRDKYVVDMNANEQAQRWDEMYARKLEKELKQQAKEEGLAEAQEQTEEAQKNLEDLRNILNYTLDIDDAIDWDTLRPNPKYPVAEPKQPNKPLKINFSAKVSFFDKLFFQKARKEKEAQEIFLNAQNKYQSDLSEYNKKLTKWKTSLAEHEQHIKDRNAEIDEQKAAYQRGEESAIDSYCFEVLNNSEYPDSIYVAYNSAYQKDIKTCVVDFDLPTIEDMPTTKEMTYTISKQEFKEKKLLKKDIKELYEDVCHQVAIRTLHEIFEADVIDAIDLIVFNGWVDTVDKKTGHDKRACIMTVQADKKSFEGINLARVAPDECFKGLKGISASSLSTMTPVAPIMEFDMDDGRFIEGKNVIDGLEEGVNLAAIGWEEFENLVRDVFEKEFSSGGGEVKVTQSSRDGGVDAIAFDPDPIKGGKIVIQAKRYTNTVGVSAIRDLYGVVQHEGATKGILVTTSNYGPDSFSFAKDKPLTLLTGNHLLHLLEKHGIKASINLNVAKKLGNSMQR